MRYSDFEDAPSGRLVPTVFGERAFVPDDLPPEIDLAALALPLAEARGALGELRGACRRLANPYVLIRPLQRLEAQTSSAMEGTFTTADKLVLAEAELGGVQDDQAVEVANYVRALRWSVDALRDLPLSARLLKGAHERLLRHVGKRRGEDKLPGEFKRDQNMIGGASIQTARFIPPPPAETIAAMSALERYLNRPDKSATSPLIDMAIVHYQFETIHPFADGNGRVGRMLISLMALTEGVLDTPALYLSPELEKRKDEYIDLMYAVSARSEWTPWILFFLDVLTRSCGRAVRTIDSLIDLQSRYQERAMAASRSANMLQVVNMLFSKPALSAGDIVREIGITDPAARNLIRQLADLGIIEELPDYYPKVWFAPELIRLSSPD